MLLAACGLGKSDSDDSEAHIDDTPVVTECPTTANTLVVEDGWRFQTDPANVGETAGWADPDFDDSAWSDLAPGAAWENLGVEYDGAAWYRTTITLPEWDAVYLVLSRVDDSLRLWLDGKPAGEWSLSAQQAVSVDLADYGDPGEAITVALRVDDLGGYGGLIDQVRLASAEGQGLSTTQWVQWLADSYPEWPMPG